MAKWMICTLAALAFSSAAASAQDNRLTVGGYGEVAMTRNFYNDSPYIYAKPDNYRDAPGHGRFDIPHAVVYLGYDFGKGWTMQSEIEFEHTGTGAAIEREYEEAGEFEQEIEKGGEVELEQFWIQKSFFPQLNVRMGPFRPASTAKWHSSTIPRPQQSRQPSRQSATSMTHLKKHHLQSKINHEIS